MTEIQPGHVIQGPRWPELVEVKLVEDLGDYVHLVGATTNSGEHVDQLIPRQELSQLQVARIHTDFTASPREVFLALEARRYRFASLYDPLLAMNTSKIDPLPHQIEAVYATVAARPSTASPRRLRDAAQRVQREETAGWLPGRARAGAGGSGQSNPPTETMGGNRTMSAGYDSDIVDEVMRRIFAVVRPHRIVLFGSAARGEMAADSDLDLLVIVPEPAHRRALAQEIYRNLHGIPVPVDIVVATEQDVEQYGDKVGTILRPALKEGQVIYERTT